MKTDDTGCLRSLTTAVTAALLVLGWPAVAAAQQTRSILPIALAGSFDLQYDSVRIEGTVFHLEGDVDLVDEIRGIRLLADQVSFDHEQLSFEATGNVSFEQGDLLLNGKAMRGDLDDSTLEMEQVVGIAPGPFYIRAKRVRQIEPGKFHAEGGVVTPCNQTVSIWEFRSGSMTFKPGSYVRMAWPHVRVKGVPIFGLPYIYWPLQDSQRQTGLLVPSIGSSTRKGFMVSQSLFWAINRSADMTLTYEHFGNAGSGFAGEFRHALSESANGFVRAYYLPGRQATVEEAALGTPSFAEGFSLTASHIQQLPAGFNLRIGADYISSTEFARDFRDDFAGFLQRRSFVSTEVSRSWGSSTLSIVGNSDQRFDTNTISTVGRKLPMVRYNLRSTQLLGPVYVSLQSSAARLEKVRLEERARTTREDGGVYSRFDAFPSISVPITQIPWLTFNPFFNWRTTRWSHRTRADEFKFAETPITRHLYETGVEVVGPSIFKIFETPGSEYSPRFKHVIQPRLTYRRVRTMDRPGLDRIIQFDEVDFTSFDTQTLVAEVTMRLFGKRYPDRNAEERMVWQVGELTFGRSVNLEPLSDELEAAGAPRINMPYFLRARITPTDRFWVQGDVTFTPAMRPGSYRMSAEARGNLASIGLSWFRGVRDFLDPENLSRVLTETNSNTLQATSSAEILGRRLTLGASIGLDLFENRLQNVNGSLQWNLQCCSIGVDVRRINFAGRDETQFSVLLNLAQVGTLGFDNQRR